MPVFAHEDEAWLKAVRSSGFDFEQAAIDLQHVSFALYGRRLTADDLRTRYSAAMAAHSTGSVAPLPAAPKDDGGVLDLDLDDLLGSDDVAADEGTGALGAPQKEVDMSEEVASAAEATQQLEARSLPALRAAAPSAASVKERLQSAFDKVLVALGGPLDSAAAARIPLPATGGGAPRVLEDEPAAALALESSEEDRVAAAAVAEEEDGGSSGGGGSSLAVLEGTLNADALASINSSFSLLAADSSLISAAPHAARPAASGGAAEDGIPQLSLPSVSASSASASSAHDLAEGGDAHSGAFWDELLSDVVLPTRASAASEGGDLRGIILLLSSTSGTAAR